MIASGSTSSPFPTTRTSLKGLMFDMVDSDGRPISAEYARTRMRWEPLVEVLQMKGTSETHPSALTGLTSLLDLSSTSSSSSASGVADARSRRPADYARTGSASGSRQFEDRGRREPIQVRASSGATDSHTMPSATPDEDNCTAGKTGNLDSGPPKGARPRLPVRSAATGT